MPIQRLHIAIPKLVDQIVKWNSPRNRGLTVVDLRNAIYRARMSEISDWSERDLDVMEVHAARFEGSAPLESVLDIPTGAELPNASITVGSIPAPSPFAW